MTDDEIKLIGETLHKYLLKKFRYVSLRQKTIDAIAESTARIAHSYRPEFISLPIEYVAGKERGSVCPANLYTCLVSYGIILDPKDVVGKKEVYVPGHGTFSMGPKPGLLNLLPEKPVRYVTIECGFNIAP